MVKTPMTRSRPRPAIVFSWIVGTASRRARSLLPPRPVTMGRTTHAIVPPRPVRTRKESEHEPCMGMSPILSREAIAPSWTALAASRLAQPLISPHLVAIANRVAARKGPEHEQRIEIPSALSRPAIPSTRRAGTASRRARPLVPPRPVATGISPLVPPHPVPTLATWISRPLVPPRPVPTRKESKNERRIAVSCIPPHPVATWIVTPPLRRLRGPPFASHGPRTRPRGRGGLRGGGGRCQCAARQW